ncbi:MAG TPA: site-specific integrase, partial [Terriglobales bacterium]|nr:site-specific integrase [Terriglobales bacterium]
MNDLIERYVGYLRDERNLSPHTLRNYRADLSQFCEFLVARGLCLGEDKRVRPEAVNLATARAYLAFLMKDRKKSSVGRKLAALKG